ncbi:hypothetical protein [Nitrosopumilus ureiphilus]|nr:hypothetical protein [Nitrosopumilus ureiphilus]
MTESQNENTVEKLILQNTCENCGSKFKPIKSMTFETLCNACLENKSK